MGKPSMSYVMLSICEYIAYQKAHPEERNILVPGGRERKFDSLSSGERNGKSPTNKLACWGCTDHTELQRTTLDESSGKMNQRR